MSIEEKAANHSLSTIGFVASRSTHCENTTLLLLTNRNLVLT